MIHELKVWPPYYDDIADQRKTFEVRKHDRNFQVGDILHLREYDPMQAAYTGRKVKRAISYILKGGYFGIEAGYCVLGIKRMN